MEKRLITVKELSIYLGKSEGSIYQMIFRKEIPHIKLGRSVRFDLQEINEWIEKHSVKEVEYDY